MPTERFAIDGPFDLRRTTRALGAGITDDDGAWWWATRVAATTATVRIARSDDGVVATAWGDGGVALLARVPVLLGLDDDPEPAWVGRAGDFAARTPGLRLGATRDVHGALVKGILGQVVTRPEAARSMRSLLDRHGTVAPGPNRHLRIVPAPADLAALSYDTLHDLGIERRRAEVMIEVARRAPRLVTILDMDVPDAYARLTAVRGVGPWTAALVMATAYGDRDAVQVGDYHLPNTIAWALAGEERATDERMLELLEPYRPQRRRLVVSIVQSGVHAPRFGPRTPVRRHL